MTYFCYTTTYRKRVKYVGLNLKLDIWKHLSLEKEIEQELTRVPQIELQKNFIDVELTTEGHLLMIRYY